MGLINKADAGYDMIWECSLDFGVHIIYMVLSYSYWAYFIEASAVEVDIQLL